MCRLVYAVTNAIIIREKCTQMQKIRSETSSNNETRYSVRIIILIARFFILLNNILPKKKKKNILFHMRAYIDRLKKFGFFFLFPRF